MNKKKQTKNKQTKIISYRDSLLMLFVILFFLFLIGKALFYVTSFETDKKKIRKNCICRTAYVSNIEVIHPWRGTSKRVCHYYFREKDSLIYGEEIISNRLAKELTSASPIEICFEKGDVNKRYVKYKIF